MAGPLSLIVMAIMASGGVAEDEILVSSGDYELWTLPDPGSAAAGLYFKTDGVLSRNSGPTDSGTEWLVSGVASAWSIKATLTAGTTPTTNAGLATWLALTSGRTWANTRTDPSEGVGITTSTLTFDFSDDGGSTTKYTFTGNIIAAELAF